MRLISFVSGLLAILLLAGGAASAANKKVFEAGLLTDVDAGIPGCAEDKLVHSAVQGIDHETTALDPERISILMPSDSPV